MSDQPTLQTPLHALHVELGGRMVAFAGYDMPVQYPAGIVAEHLHTRHAAGLFDVSHMGQALLSGRGAGAGLETLVPGDILGLAEGRMRYTQLLNADGDILDDLMVARLHGLPGEDETLMLVVNAATKAADFALISEKLPQLRLETLDDRALLAVQGPEAAMVLARHFGDLADMPFLSTRAKNHGGAQFHLSRCGYTGEDGFEISLPARAAESFARILLDEPEVKPIGLGARDSLRLEAGLCLYGHDIDATTTPIEAGLAWSIAKRRQIEGGFPGDERVRLQLAHGPDRSRVGIELEGKLPAREGAEITTAEGARIGAVTSGGYAPSLSKAIAMGYVDQAHATVGAPVRLIVRGKPLPGKIVRLPFVAANFHRVRSPA